MTKTKMKKAGNRKATMAHIKNYKEFVEGLERDAYNPEKKRMQVLAGIISNDSRKSDTYLVEITFASDSHLLEHIKLKGFKNSTNKMLKHPETAHPPVKAHYHVYPKNGKEEIYAVNMDGTAHHQKNKGYEIPKKEAEELRSLGVNIRPDNIIEWLETSADDQRQLLTESLNENSFTILLEIDAQKN